MKKLILLSATIFLINFSFAQMAVHDSSAFLDINQIKARIVAGGVNFYDTSSFVGYVYPADSQSQTILTSALWIGAKNQNNLHLVAERYHANGRDYYPGPVMDSISYQSQVVNWNKVWKINKSEIDNHIINWNTPGYVIPNSISHWPVYANPSLNINHDLAPYVDTDSDGFYNPANGDYPYIRGDQAIYFIFNDSVFKHTESGGQKLGVEVHAMAYAYNSNPLLRKTIFVNYLIYNNSSRVYDSLYIGLFTDFDIGEATDDYIGCDTLLNTYYGYNADSVDGTFNNPHWYGNNPPVQAVSFCSQPMNSFAYFNNTGANQSMTDPHSASDYYLIMTSRWKDSSHFAFGGDGHYLNGGDSTKPVNYIFPGNPNDTSQWNETSAGNFSGDRRGVGISGPFQLIPGQYIAYDVSYITVDSSSVMGIAFPNIEKMFQTIPLICDFVNTNIPTDGHDLALGINSNGNSNDVMQFDVFPSPASDKITLICNHAKEMQIDIFDINGKRMQSIKCNDTKTELDVSMLRQGVFILKIYNNNQSGFSKFVKM